MTSLVGSQRLHLALTYQDNCASCSKNRKFFGVKLVFSAGVAQVPAAGSGALEACHAQGWQALQRERAGVPESSPPATSCGRRGTSYESAWTAVPLCSVTIVALANQAGAAEDISGQLSVVSCQCLAMPAGDS